MSKEDKFDGILFSMAQEHDGGVPDVSYVIELLLFKSSLRNFLNHCIQIRCVPSFLLRLYSQKTVFFLNDC